jgi:hypothetical protein
MSHISTSFDVGKCDIKLKRYFPHRFVAAFFAISFRRLADNPAAFAAPPFRPSATAPGPCPLSGGGVDSSISPVATLRTEAMCETAGPGFRLKSVIFKENLSVSVKAPVVKKARVVKKSHRRLRPFAWD